MHFSSMGRSDTARNQGYARARPPKEQAKAVSESRVRSASITVPSDDVDVIILAEAIWSMTIATASSLQVRKKGE